REVPASRAATLVSAVPPRDSGQDDLAPGCARPGRGTFSAIRPRMGSRRLACLTALSVGSGACHHQRPAAVPGDTEISVSAVDILPRDGEVFEVDYHPLRENLGLHKN